MAFWRCYQLTIFRVCGTDHRQWLSMRSGQLLLVLLVLVGYLVKDKKHFEKAWG